MTQPITATAEQIVEAIENLPLNPFSEGMVLVKVPVWKGRFFNKEHYSIDHIRKALQSLPTLDEREVLMKFMLRDASEEQLADEAYMTSINYIIDFYLNSK